MKLKLLAAALAVLSTGAQAQSPCTVTRSVGANLVADAGNIANTVICLNSGNYGSINFFDLNVTNGRSSHVTIRPVAGASVTIQPQIGNSRFLRFSGVTIGGYVLVNSCSQQIQFVNSTWAPHTQGLDFDGSTCASALNQGHVLDGMVFDRVRRGNWEGRLNFRDVNGATVRNSTFSGISGPGDGIASDGIQMQGASRNIVIENNVFTGILDALCGGIHCDALQLQDNSNITIRGNLFENGDTFIMSPDRCSSVTLANNVFNGAAVSNEYKLQFGGCTSLTFEHNTMYRAGAAFDSKAGDPATTATVRNNIWASQYSLKTSNGSGCSGCTFTNNLTIQGFDLTNCSGCTQTGTITGSATFTGGSPPTTRAGWQLATGSLGKGTAADGLDRGTTFFGVGAPSNFRRLP